MSAAQKHRGHELKVDDPNSTASSASTEANRQLTLEAGSSMVAVAVMLSLIFGGCCSNVSSNARTLKEPPTDRYLLRSTP
jgi:hypothetical protein